mgnify:CR=1 FL=1
MPRTTRRPSLVRERVARITRLDSCGRFVYGEYNQAITDGIITVTFISNTNTTDEISVVKMDGQGVEERVVSAAGSFLTAYLLVLLVGALVVSWDNFGFQESFAASLTCISNVGPGLGILGPMENFSILSPLSKVVLSVEMLMGRLELMPLLALFLGSTWRD